MRRFRPERPCPKCAGLTKDVHFDPRERQLEVTCRTCGYEERFAPLDAEPDPR